MWHDYQNAPKASSRTFLCIVTCGYLESNSMMSQNGHQAAKWSTDQSTSILIYGCTPKYMGEPTYLGVHLYFNIQVDPYMYRLTCNLEVHPCFRGAPIYYRLTPKIWVDPYFTSVPAYLQVHL